MRNSLDFGKKFILVLMISDSQKTMKIFPSFSKSQLLIQFEHHHGYKS